MMTSRYTASWMWSLYSLRLLVLLVRHNGWIRLKDLQFCSVTSCQDTTALEVYCLIKPACSYIVDPTTPPHVVSNIIWQLKYFVTWQLSKTSLTWNHSPPGRTGFMNTGKKMAVTANSGQAMSMSTPWVLVNFLLTSSKFPPSDDELPVALTTLIVSAVTSGRWSKSWGLMILRVDASVDRLP